MLAANTVWSCCRADTTVVYEVHSIRPYRLIEPEHHRTLIKCLVAFSGCYTNLLATRVTDLYQGAGVRLIDC